MYKFSYDLAVTEDYEMYFIVLIAKDEKDNIVATNTINTPWFSHTGVSEIARGKVKDLNRRQKKGFIPLHEEGWRIW